MYGPMQLALTLASRLQILHTCWYLHWHMDNVRASGIGSYIDPWITNLPYLLAFTLSYRLQTHHTYWCLH